jgi:hypothetical protein
MVRPWWSDVEKVDTETDGSAHRANAFLFLEPAVHASQRRGTESKD